MFDLWLGVERKIFKEKCILHYMVNMDMRSHKLQSLHFEKYSWPGTLEQLLQIYRRMANVYHTAWLFLLLGPPVDLEKRTYNTFSKDFTVSWEVFTCTLLITFLFIYLINFDIILNFTIIRLVERWPRKRNVVCSNPSRKKKPGSESFTAKRLAIGVSVTGPRRWPF